MRENVYGSAAVDRQLWLRLHGNSVMMLLTQDFIPVPASHQTRSWIAFKGSWLGFGDNQVVIHLDTSSFPKKDGRLSTQVGAFL